jgi:hypothetical protein
LAGSIRDRALEAGPNDSVGERFDARGEWRGRYNNRVNILLTVDGQDRTSFTGTLTYDDGVVTRVEGSIHGDGPRDCTVMFREVRFLSAATGGVDLEGEYHAQASGDSMRGRWTGHRGLSGVFELQRARNQGR